MSALIQLARLFGVKLDAVDDAMRSERGYRAALSRRSLLDDAYGERENHMGIGREPDYELEQVPGHHRLGILSFADGNIAGHDDDYDFVATRTMDEWIRRNGPGFLCTVEH